MYKKKRKNKYIFVILLFLIVFSIFYYLINFQKKSEFFIIQSKKNQYYIILDNPGGKNIPDIGINILENNLLNHPSNNYDNNLLSNKFHSLQLFASNQISKVNEKKKLFSDLDEINSNDLFITKLKTNLGTTYLLLYKNFTNKKLAIKECNNINKLKIECLVVFIDSLN